MKRTFIAIALLAISFVTQAQEFPGITEGKEYKKEKITETVVDANQSKPVLVEFFWYGCSHCNAMRPLAEKFVKKQGDKIISVKYPVLFPNWESGARIFFTYQEMKVLDKMHDVTFNEIHANRNVKVLLDEKTRNQFVKGLGLEPEKFNSIYNSFSTNTKILKAKKMTESHKIEGSPMYAVYSNGYTYQTSPSMAGGYDKTIDVLDKIISAKLKK